MDKAFQNFFSPKSQNVTADKITQINEENILSQARVLHALNRAAVRRMLSKVLVFVLFAE